MYYFLIILLSKLGVKISNIGSLRIQNALSTFIKAKEELISVVKDEKEEYNKVIHEIKKLEEIANDHLLNEMKAKKVLDKLATFLDLD